MGARQKLNRAYVNGALVCAAIAGLRASLLLTLIVVSMLSPPILSAQSKTPLQGTKYWY